MDIFTRIALILYITMPNIFCDCNWPANLQNSIWHDSDKGQLDFATETMSGLDYLVQNAITINTWDCLYYYQSSGILIMKSQDTVTLFSTAYRPFQCIKLTAITDYSYYYYIQAATAVRVGGERIMLEEDSDIGTITETNAEARLCNVSGTASDTEYHVLLKDNQEENAAQICPGIFKDEFWYEIDDGGTTSCGSQNERWDVCTDTSTMEFDYSMCSTQIAYSSSGIVRCMATLATGNSILTTVMNTDSSPTYMFTCFMSKVSSTGTLLVSQSPKSCTLGQTPETQPVHPDGTQGLLLELTAHATSACDHTTTASTTPTSTTTTTTPAHTTTSSPDDKTWVKLAAVLGGVAVFLILMLLGGFILYRVCRKKRPTTTEPVREPTPPPTPEPDLIIEDMPHKLSGNSVLKPRFLMGPRETSMKDGNIPRTNLHVFPDAKRNNFKITMANTPDPYAPSPALPNRIITDI